MTTHGSLAVSVVVVGASLHLEGLPAAALHRFTERPILTDHKIVTYGICGSSQVALVASCDNCPKSRKFIPCENL